MVKPGCESLIERIHQLTARLNDINNEAQDIGNEALSVHNVIKNMRFQRMLDRLFGEQRALRDQWTTSMDQLAICRLTASEDAASSVSI